MIQKKRGLHTWKFDLSPVSPKGEKRFASLIKKNKGDDDARIQNVVCLGIEKGKAFWFLPFRGGGGEVGDDFGGDGDCVVMEI